MRTATQMQLATYTPADAFGPRGIPVTIAGHDCRAWRELGYWNISNGHEVQSFREDVCDFEDARELMEEFFQGMGL